MIMTLLISVFYIVWFTHHSLVRFAPCFAAVSGDVPCTDPRVRRARKVSLAYIAGALIYAATLGVVVSEALQLIWSLY